MQVSCPRCSRMLDYSGERPSFCAYCGQPLGSDAGLDTKDSDARLLATAEYDAGFNTPLPLIGSNQATEAGGHRSRSGCGNLPETRPERIATYKLIKLLGRGGMGSVYEAEDVDVGRRVALKLIAADHVASPEAVERFRQEGRLASTLAHPRCVFVLGADEHEGRPYIVMELMPGATLQTAVEANGPFPIGEAVARILDVIEGLQEAHLSGVIHRDVKPSNCFLDTDGRVKVGDFGLSKSLDGDAGLTRTGSFVGTPLYASPEQIKRDAVDGRTDVYSTAATLYFLLTAKPPFEAGDAAATLAKIVSEKPTPLRNHRPEVPVSLVAVVGRGLERDRDRRYPDLRRLRQALLPFVSDRLRLADLALRLSAYFLDCLFLMAIHALTFSVMVRGRGLAEGPFGLLGLLVGQITPGRLAFERLVFLAYFAAFEGLWGWSPGKRITGLRVRKVEGGGGPPGLKGAAARVALFYLVSSFVFDAATLAVFAMFPLRHAALIEPLLVLVFRSLGFLAAASTMRAANGYRGIHELISGTRVVRLAHGGRLRAPRGRRLPARGDRARELVSRAAGVHDTVGPFKVRGAVRWEADHRVLLGEDPALKRSVWIVYRPKGSAPPPQSRRDLGRASRPRWLAGGEQQEGRWDAYVAPAGCTLAELAGADGLAWADVRPILHDLADELARAAADGTLPEGLSVDQVWVQPDGTVQLADPFGPPSAATSGMHPVTPVSDQARALDLLRRTAALALEGGRGRRASGGTGGSPKAIRATVPEHAARMLDRLIGRPRDGETAYVDLTTIVADMEADRDKPTEVDAARRLVHIVPSAAAVFIPLGLMFSVAFPRTSAFSDYPYVFWLVPLIWVLWAALTRGGALRSLAGLAVVRWDSRPAERWRCGWRALVLWGPFAGLLAASFEAMKHSPKFENLAWVLWGGAHVLLVVFLALSLIFPSRSVHDWLAGTWVVPK